MKRILLNDHQMCFRIFFNTIEKYKIVVASEYVYIINLNINRLRYVL